VAKSEERIMFKTKLSPVAPDGSRLPTVSLTVAFSAGAVSAVLVLACGGHTTTSARGAALTAAADAAEGPTEPVAAQSRPWLPTRTFDCPECGCAVPTNDNAPPILLLGFVGQGLNCLIYGRNLVFIRAGKLATEREDHERS
jgi:hypothetical protein